MASRSHVGFSAPQPETGTQLILIKGLPRSFDFRFLKDNVRAMLPHSAPGWTVQKGCGGYVSLTSGKDAKTVYAAFTKRNRGGRPLSVHHFDTSGTGPELIRCNCHPTAVCPHNGRPSTMYKCNCLPGSCIWSPSATGPPGTTPIFGAAGVSSSSEGTSVSSSPAISTCSLNNAALEPHPAMIVYAGQRGNPGPIYPAPTATMPLPTHSVFPPPSDPIWPVYSTSFNGTPVNVAKGAVRTECRGVFLSNLHFSVSKSDIERLLRPFGTVSKCTIRRSPSSKGRPKPTATASFDSQGQASAAVMALKDTQFMGRALEIHLDREETVTMPLIVHGDTNPSS